jgi:hypothetical protein
MQPVLRIRIDESTPGYRVYNVGFCYDNGSLQDYGTHYGERHWQDDSSYHKTLDLRHVGMRAQMDDRETNTEPYGWDYEPKMRPAHHSDLDIEDLEIMLSTLKTIERRFTKMIETEGRAESFAGQVRRLARAVGSKSVRFETRHDHFPGGYTWTLNDGIEHLKDNIRSYALNKR